MIKIRIKIKSDNKTYTHNEFVHDDYVISKTNPEFEHLVDRVCKDAKLDPVEDVKITATFEW